MYRVYKKVNITHEALTLTSLLTITKSSLEENSPLSFAMKFSFMLFCCLAAMLGAVVVSAVPFAPADLLEQAGKVLGEEVGSKASPLGQMPIFEDHIPERLKTLHPIKVRPDVSDSAGKNPSGAYRLRLPAGNKAPVRDYDSPLILSPKRETSGRHVGQ